MRRTDCDSPRRRARNVLFAHFDGTNAVEGLWSEPSPAEGEDSTRESMASTVRTALETVLTARQRSVVEMFFFEGVSQGEIARRMGVTQQVVHKCLYGDARAGRVVGGAIAKLRRALEPVMRATHARAAI